VAVATSQVLGGNDGYGIAGFGFYQQYLAVGVGRSESAVTDFLAFERYHFGRVLVENKH